MTSDLLLTLITLAAVVGTVIFVAVVFAAAGLRDSYRRRSPGQRGWTPESEEARIELRIMFEDLLTRDVTLAPAGDVDFLRSNFVHGIKRMPVRVV